jgi:hypothetical protein
LPCAAAITKEKPSTVVRIYFINDVCVEGILLQIYASKDSGFLKKIQTGFEGIERIDG